LIVLASIVIAAFVSFVPVCSDANLLQYTVFPYFPPLTSQKSILVKSSSRLKSRISRANFARSSDGWFARAENNGAHCCDALGDEKATG
jgi:hypothetical protein